jgi:hypothetical protein
MIETATAPVAHPFPAIPLSAIQAVTHLTGIYRGKVRHDFTRIRQDVATRDAMIDVLRLEPSSRSASSVAAFFRRLGGAAEPIERLRLSGLFLPGWYAEQQRSRIGAADAWTHFEQEGLTQGLAPNPFFDPAWYAERHSLASAHVAPILHYVTDGARYGLAPGPLFDPVDYMVRYNDVSGEPDLLAHFLKRGIFEGRKVNPLALPLPERFS